MELTLLEIVRYEKNIYMDFRRFRKLKSREHYTFFYYAKSIKFPIRAEASLCDVC